MNIPIDLTIDLIIDLMMYLPIGLYSSKSKVYTDAQNRR